MRIELWLTEKYKKGTQALFLVKLDELGPIEDDTGKLLTTKKRLEWIKHLKWEVSETNMRITRNKMGPTMGFTIDAPARQATKIKSLKGKATVAEYTSVQIEIDNKTAFSGKVLDHPKLKGLAIKPTIAFEDGSTSVNLNMPNESGRLDEWGLIEKGKYASLESIAGNERTFRGDHRNAASVWFIIRDPSNTKTLTFDFKDIELP
jgi:hypothetical protein